MSKESRYDMYESDYSEMPLNGKKMMCQKVLDFAMEMLWLEEILLEFKSVEFFITQNSDAVFLKESYTIVLNEDWLEEVGIAEFTATILHETRHAYQCAQVEFYDSMKYQESKEIVAQWKLDLNNYVPTSGDEHNDIMYMKQSIEIDAVAFEMKMMKDLLDIDLTPNAMIAEDVARVNIVINEKIIN